MVWLLVEDVERKREVTQREGKEGAQRLSKALRSYMCSNRLLSTVDEPILAWTSNASVPIGPYLSVH